ncbi:MAG: alpha/beta hydrolase [Thermoguttaceae bacterium]|jgi:pimeloyl-ACP methyl ester carboxylesterase
MQNFTRTDVAFVSSGTRCAAWLYRPQGVAWPPVVVMAHGFGAERSFGLPQFAERFAAAGWAAFLFDYRTFGASDGQPRNLVSPRRHLQDWRAALGAVRQMRDVDPGRVALWGTSLSGGHVLVLAAEDPGIATIVSQVPFVDPVASARQLGISYSIRACVAGLRDWLRAITFRRPYYVPVYGPPGTLACLATADAAEGYRAMVPPDSEWRNACPARCLLATLFYRPHSAAPRVRCPALLVVAEQDTLSPAWVVRQTAQAMPAATLLALPGGHFSVYQGPTLETVIAAEIDFLRKQFAG